LDLAQAIALLIEHGNSLRRSGVRDLRVGDLYVTLAPPDHVVEAVEPEQDIGDPLLDPLTYGRRSQVPGFDREAE
jgi:hypothetical protein